MSGAAQYLMTLICGAFVCALVRSLAGDGPGKGIRDLLCGLFMALLVLSPLGTLELPELDLSEIRMEAEAAAMEGAEQAALERNAIISRELEAYICNRAEEMGLNITARVEVDDDGLPVAVTLTGFWTEPRQKQLSGIIEESLGIEEEAQTWKKQT